MKKVVIVLIAIVGFVVLGTQDTYAQTQKNTQEKVYKTSVQKSPSKVRETLKDYSNYTISEAVTYTKKSVGNSTETIYKFKVTKGIFSHFLIINESGKVIAIDTGEQASN